MRRFMALTALLVAVVGVLALGNRASATNAVMDDFTRAYPATAGTALASCSTCHTSVPTLNPYGSAVKSSGFNFNGIEGLDSDGDGFTNLEEIRALTRPGDPSSRPTTTTTTTTTTTSATSPTSTTRPTSTTSSTTSTTAPSLSAAVAPTVAPSGAVAYDAGPAGTVWLAIKDGRLKVVDIDTTWRFGVEEEHDDDGDFEIEVKFRSGNQEVEFEAELEDGTIRTKVEIESEDDDRGHDDDDDNDDDHGDHRGRDHDDDDGDDHDDD